MEARMRGLSLVAAGFAALSVPGIAAAQDLQGAKPLTTAKPQGGFVDDWFSFDGAGGRLLWINADAAARAEIRVVDLAQGGAQLAAVDISRFTLAPLRAHFVLDGNSFFVVAPGEDDGPMRAALIDGTGKVVRSFGPATDIVLHEGARTEVVTYNRESKPNKKGGPTITHTVSI